VKKTVKLIFALALSCLMVGNAQAGLNDGLVAHYPFNGNANDESGNNNHGTVNGATLTLDRFENANSAYSFDGKDSHISVADSSSLHFGINSFSFSLWINANTFQGEYHEPGSAIRILSKSLYPSTWWVIDIYSKGNLEMEMDDNDTNSGTTNSIGTITPLAWYHVAIVVDRVNQVVKYYFNGELDSEQPLPEIFTEKLNVEGTSIEIGSSWNTFNGSIDALYIYRRSLSQCEIKSLYTSKDECNLDCSDNPATYSIEKKQSKLIIPFIDIPLLEPDTHQPTNEIGVFQGELKLKKGIFVDFEIVPNRLKFISFTQTVDACHAVYSYQDKTLSIPFVKVGSEVYEATLKHLQEVPFDLGVFRLKNYEFLHTLD